jgi:hypothetical protein
MGKRRVQSRQVRQIRQVRQVRPKNLPAPASGDQRKQRERYVRSGGMLQGYAPETVVMVGRLAAAGAVLCALVAVALLLLLPYGWPVRAVAAVVWIVPIGFAASFILPGFQLARKDLKLEPKLVQGQLVGANEASTSIALGMLMLKTRGGGFEQYLVEPEKLSKVPGNQVNVMLSVTPNLRHVRSVGIVGQRLMGRPDQPVPAIVKRLRILPIATPVALSAVAIVGVNAVALLPLYPDWAHALLAFGTGAVLAGAVFGASHLLQRRLISEVQALMPGGLP